MKAGHHALLPPFFMSWFLQPTHLHYFIFLQLESVIIKNVFAKKINKCSHSTKQKLMPQKNGVSYLNIKWPYRFASHFFCSAYLHANTRKKSYKHFMLSSQQRNTNGSKLHLCKHANAFASVVEAVPPTAPQRYNNHQRQNRFISNINTELIPSASLSHHSHYD
jgi:hypothetical protein